MQTTINLGRVACNPMGMYNAATTYNRLDMVMWGGTGYICCANNVTNIPPSSDDTKWKPIVDASQISEFQVEELMLKDGDEIMADITTDANGMAIETNSITIDSGNDSVHVAGDTVTITDGNDVNTITCNEIYMKDIDGDHTVIRPTQIITDNIITRDIDLGGNGDIYTESDVEGEILHIADDVVVIEGSTSIENLDALNLTVNSSVAEINLETYNPDSQIVLHKNGKTVQLKNGVLDTDEAYVKELNMNADGDMGGVIVFGDKYGSENIIELSEREDDQLTIQAPNILCSGPSVGQGLPNIYFKQKTGTNTYGLPSLKLEWDGTTLPRPNIKTRFGLSMNSDGIDYGLYLNYGNVWSDTNTFKFKNIELPYTWRGSTITPVFKVGEYQIKHINGQWGQVEIGEYDNSCTVNDYNYKNFYKGLNLVTRYDGEGGYEDQTYIYFGTFDGDEGEQSGVINAEFGLNYSGKELNIWDWDEYDKMTLKTVHDENLDETEHIIQAPNKLTVSSETQVVISTPTTHINSDELNVSVDSMSVSSDNDIELATNGARVVVGGQLVIASGNTLKIGNTVITEAQLQALLELIS